MNNILDDINIGILLYSLIILIADLFGGCKLDAQLNYPHESIHSVLIPKRFKKFLFFKNRKNKRECLKAAYIIEIAAYIQFTMAILIASIFLILNYEPDFTITFTIIDTYAGISGLYTIVVYAYYKLKYK